MCDVWNKKRRRGKEIGRKERKDEIHCPKKKTGSSQCGSNL
jgi:hypothetical protein